MLARVGAAVGLIVLCAISVFRVAHPPSPVPATAPDTVFSAERALHHVEAIAQRPHPMGTADHERVRDYILAQLTALGLRPQVQTATGIGTRYQSAGRVQNILAWVPGSNTNGKAVLVIVHYDGVGAGPAASDDGAGSAALLETLRALRARKQPLAHDVIALFTDGEEAGLLGAAAFVREHPWAKDVAIALNFEARGTTGRSYMFETGPGNQDAVSALRAARDVTAGSVFTTIYRTLPNDTDVSELAVLGLPALNFAFADGVERYHTSRDDVAHLNLGSLQHHGLQMLALTETFANGTLPRPTTGDAVFFDLPLIGMVIYPMWIALPLAIVALVLAAIVVAPATARRGIIPGFVATLFAVTIAGGLARFVNLGGAGRWSGVYALALVLGVLAVNAAIYSFARRRWPNLHSGTLVVWLVLSLVTSAWMPGASYLFTWPLLFALVAARSRHPIAQWAAATVTLILLAGLVFSVTAVMLGVAGTGAIALAVITSLIAWLLAPILDRVVADASWGGAPWLAGATVVVSVIGLLVVKQTADHPIRSGLVYAESADSGGAWLGAYGQRDSWTRSALGAASRGPDWTSRLNGSRSPLNGRDAPRVSLGAPTATLVRDTIINGARRVVVRVTAPAGTTSLIMHAVGAPVLTASIDGRVVDTTRYRRHAPVWMMEYWAVPDSGAVVALSIPVGGHIDFDLAAWRPGLPPLPGITIPPRPPEIVPSQDGDVSISYRRAHF